MSRSISSLSAEAQSRLSGRRSISSLSASVTAPKPATQSAPIFVIEIGSRLTRIGFAGEYEPREILRTEVNYPYSITAVPLYDSTRTDAEQLTVLCTFFRNITLKKLTKSAINLRVVIVENLFWPREYRDAIARALFEDRSLSISAICFAPSPLMHSFTFNMPIGLVVDVGVSECILFPVCERFVMLNSFESTPLSTRAVEEEIRRLLKDQGRVIDHSGSQRLLDENDWKLFDRMNCAEDICFRFCFSTTRERGLKIQQRAELASPPPVIIPFGSEKLLIPGDVREAAAEVLFCNSDDQRSIPEIIIDCVAKSPVDLRTEFLRHLLFVGGLSRMNGFISRVQEELKFLLSKRFPHMKKLGFIRREGRTGLGLYSAWMGASLLATVTVDRFYSRSDWESKKHVPDWSDVIDEERLAALSVGEIKVTVLPAEEIST